MQENGVRLGCTKTGSGRDTGIDIILFVKTPFFRYIVEVTSEEVSLWPYHEPRTTPLTGRPSGKSADVQKRCAD